MLNYISCIGKRITIKQGIEDWDMIERCYKWRPITGVLTNYRRWTDDNGAITYWATINGTEYNVTGKNFKVVE